MSWAKVLAWLPDAPPNVVPLGKVTIWGFCSSGRCTTNCCGGGCGAHPPSMAATTTPRMPITIVLSILFRFSGFFSKRKSFNLMG